MRVVANSLVLHDLSFRHIWKRPNTTHKVTPLQGAYHCLKGTAKWRDTVWFFFFKVLVLDLFCKSDLTFQSLLQKKSDTLIARTLPPQGHFFLSGYKMKNPEEEDLPCWTSFFFMGGPFAPGSWFGNHPTKILPRGGGFLTINLQPRYQRYLPDESCNTCALATPLISTCSLFKKRALFLFSSFGSIVDLCVRSSLSEGTWANLSLYCVIWNPSVHAWWVNVTVS